MTLSNTKQKVLLLNLPGKQAYLKDYYCNNISKSNYLHYPMDLLFLSGTLDENNFEVKVIDALAKKYTTEETINKIKDFNPDYMVGLVGSLSWIHGSSSRAFANTSKTRSGVTTPYSTKRT